MIIGKILNIIHPGAGVKRVPDRLTGWFHFSREKCIFFLALGFIQTHTNTHIRMVISEVNTIKKKKIHVQIRNLY